MNSRLITSLLDGPKHIARYARRTVRRRVSRRALCCALVINLFVWPGLHITVPDVAAIAAAARSAATAPIDDAKLLLKRLLRPRPRPQETAADRLNRVSHVTVNPAKHVLYQQQQMPFTSIA